MAALSRCLGVLNLLKTFSHPCTSTVASLQEGTAEKKQTPDREGRLSVTDEQHSVEAVSYLLIAEWALHTVIKSNYTSCLSYSCQSGR